MTHSTRSRSAHSGSGAPWWPTEKTAVRSSLSVLSLTAAVAGATLLHGGGAEAASPQSDSGTASLERVLTCHGFRATIVGDRGDDVLHGTAKRDVIVGLAGADRIHGRGGDDLVCGGRGADLVLGGGGTDRLSGGTGADTVQSSKGDRAFGGRGGDTGYASSGGHLMAGRGRDWVIAHPSAHVDMGGGDDALDIDRMSEAASDQSPRVLVGGRGTDAVSVVGDEEGNPVVIDLGAGTATSGGTSGRFAGFEDAIGDLGNDVLVGDDGPNTLLGDWGEDQLAALGGDDLVDGQEEEDSLDGGTGNDRCSDEVERPSNCESIFEDSARGSRP
jgi:Ca2+-binding RTX toxin-like protein